MPLHFLLAVTLVAGQQSAAEVPIRVRNAQVNPLDLSVTYEFVNEAADVTAFELAIVRHFADGSTLVSTQGQDWFSSSGYTAIRAVAYSRYAVWLPPYPAAKPGTHLHRFPQGPKPQSALIDADVTVTAVIRLDGSVSGSEDVVNRLFSERHAMLTEYAYWVPLLERAGQSDDPIAALEWMTQALVKPRRGEVVAGPREALQYAANQMHRWAQQHPTDGSRVLKAIIDIASQQRQLLVEQSMRKQQERKLPAT